MALTENETTFIIWACVTLFTTFLSLVVWVLNKGVNKMETIANSLSNMERDFKVLVNDHTNLKEDVKEIDKRVRYLEHER
jgi:hypothetical protein